LVALIAYGDLGEISISDFMQKFVHQRLFDNGSERAQYESGR
jgi:hypothetical protein